jgi:hypothetical protein
LVEEWRGQKAVWALLPVLFQKVQPACVRAF